MTPAAILMKMQELDLALDRDEQTLRELYYDLFRATTGSHVQIYNEAQYGSVYKNSMEEYL